MYTTPDPNRVLLLDISKWQDAPNNDILPDFQKMINKGVSGIIIKCGEGNVLDRSFRQYVNILKTLNLPYGFYWYYNNKYDPSLQAKTFISAVEKFGFPPLGIWADLEDRNSGTFIGWKSWYNFLHDLEFKYPNGMIGIYTGYYYFTEYTKSVGISSASLNWFGKFPLWIATYGGEPKIPAPWSEYTIWQFTDFLDGKSYGVESNELDGNYFNGDYDKFLDFFGIDETIDIPTEEPVSEYEVTVVWDLGASTKTAPNTGGLNYYTWKKGDKFYASALVADNLDPSNTQKLWAKISRGEHTGKYVAVKYPSSSGNPVRGTYTMIGTDSPPTVTLTHTIEVYSDGSIKVDGQSI